MKLQPVSTTGRILESTPSDAAADSRPFRATTATVLLLAVWIGLIAGFLDLGLLMINGVDRAETSIAWAAILPGSSRSGSRFWCWCWRSCSS